MNSREEKERALRTYPQRDLESPFLEKELFAEEPEAEWEPHLAALEAESPFRKAFKQGESAVVQKEGGSPSIMQTEGLYASPEAPQSFVGEHQYESPDTESFPEWFAGRIEPSGEEKGSADFEYFDGALSKREPAFEPPMRSPFHDERLFSHESAQERGLPQSQQSPFLRAFEEPGYRVDEYEESEALLNYDAELEGARAATEYTPMIGEAAARLDNEQHATREFDVRGGLERDVEDNDERPAYESVKDDKEEGEDERFLDDDVSGTLAEESEGRTTLGDPEIDMAELEREVFEMEDAPIPPRIAAGAAALGQEWSRRLNGTPDSAKMTAWLLRDYQDTLYAAHLRWRNKANKVSDDAIGNAWLVSRREHMQFRLSFPPGIKGLVNFHPPSIHVALLSEPSLIVGSGKALVAPLMVQFIKELKSRYGSFRADTYPNHGGGAFNNRGYSVDLWLSGQDNRGFFPPKESIEFLRAVNATARATDTSWRVLYNDFTVAQVLNQETGRRHVVFMGGVRRHTKGGEITGLNWHGPDPLILHFHLDIARGAQPQPSNIRSHAPSPPTSAVSSPEPSSALSPSLPFASSTTSAAAGLSGALLAGLSRRLGVAKAIAVFVAGERDENRLTNIIFSSRHPELPRDYKIAASEKALVSEWIDIRNNSVRPVLRALQDAASAGSATAPSANATTPVLSSPLALPAIKRRAPGYASYGGGHLLTTLRRLKAEGRISVSDADLETLQKMSEVESGGALASVQTYDSAYLSFGFLQYTILWGELQELIRRVPAAFARYGISLEGRYLFKKRTVPGIRGAARASDLRSRDWVERFLRAALDDDVIIAQVAKGLEDVAKQTRRLKRALGGRWSGALASPRVRALLAETYNNRPIVIRDMLPHVASRFPAGGNEPTLVQILTKEILRAYAARGEAEKGRRLTTKILRT